MQRKWKLRWYFLALVCCLVAIYFLEDRSSRLYLIFAFSAFSAIWRKNATKERDDERRNRKRQRIEEIVYRPVGDRRFNTSTERERDEWKPIRTSKT